MNFVSGTNVSIILADVMCWASALKGKQKIKLILMYDKNNSLHPQIYQHFNI